MDRQVVNRGPLRPGWPLLAIVAWAVLSFGAVYPWAYWPVFLAALVVGGQGLTDHSWRDPRLRRLAMALSALILAIGLQTIALPPSLVVELSPGVDRFFQSFQIGYSRDNLSALSLDPDATRVVLVEVVALGALLVGVARLMRKWPLDWFVSQLMTLAVVVAVVGVVQEATVGSDAGTPIFGFWRTEQGGEPFGPFVNRNHFAGWMVMVMPLVAAYGWALVQASGVRERQMTGQWVRWLGSVEGNRAVLVLTVLLVMLLAVVLTESRSGLVACAIAMLALVVFMWRTLDGRARALVTTIVVVGFLGATAWAGAGTVATRFTRAGQDAGGRLSAWQDTLRVVDDFTMFGTGMGGYRRAMTVYQSRDREALYAQAHNDYLQLLAEGGLLVAVPVFLLGVAVVGGIRRRLHAGDADPVVYWLRRGAVAGLIGIAAQSVVDFSLQIPANTVMFVTLTALALHRPRHHSSHAHRV